MHIVIQLEVSICMSFMFLLLSASLLVHRHSQRFWLQVLTSWSLNSKICVTVLSVYSIHLFLYLHENIEVLPSLGFYDPLCYTCEYLLIMLLTAEAVCLLEFRTMLLSIFARPFMICVWRYSATNRRFSTGDCVIWRIISHTVSTATSVGRCSRNTNCSSPSYSPLKFWSEWFLQVEQCESQFFWLWILCNFNMLLIFFMRYFV